MNLPAISVTGLAKRYRISHEKARYGRLTESLSGLASAPLARLRGSSPSTQWFWALRDVTFDVPTGSALGIIGRNGAGKSTLLKILSRITEPTSGKAVLRGRHGALLEVGTGFHPELTGRENTFLSGAILGMKRSEIVSQFDEIVEFAGVGAFIDTPVKRYSSGMQVRLGFAVAAHLNHDILFVDEVLAVGDAEFQRKCLRKLSEIGSGGRTVVFVSHNMPAVLRLCESALLLDRGTVVTAGRTQEVVSRYLSSDLGKTSERAWDIGQEPGDAVARLRRIRVLSGGDPIVDEIDIRKPIDVEVEYSAGSPAVEGLSVGLHFYNDEGACLFATHDWNDRSATGPRRGLVRATCHVPGNFFAEGRVSLTVSVATVNPLVNHAVERDAVAFVVVDHSHGDGVRGPYTNDWPGVVRPWLDWRVENDAALAR